MIVLVGSSGRIPCFTSGFTSVQLAGWLERTLHVYIAVIRQLKLKPKLIAGESGCSVPLLGWEAPLMATCCCFLSQKKKGKEAGSGAALPPPRVPALPPEARAPNASSPAAAKRSRAKAKGKEVKKEVRLTGPEWGAHRVPQAWANFLAQLTGRGVPGCVHAQCQEPLATVS